MKIKFHIYEIYTKNPETGETGWDIKFIYASEAGVKQYPDFDCIVTVDDAPIGATITNWK